MRLSSALAAGLLAARASAFFVPPHVSDAVVELRKGLASVLAGVPQAVELDCPGCPFADVKTALWHADVANKIHLEFDASLSSGLSINNKTVLTSAFDAPLPTTLTATQISTEDGTSTDELPLDFALERLEPVHDTHNSEQMIIPVRFTIFAIGGRSVKVDTIAIDMVRTESTFTIGKISNIPFNTTPGAKTCESASRWLLCRIKAFIMFRMQQMAAATRKHVHGWKQHGCVGRKNGQDGLLRTQDKSHHNEHHHPRHHRHGRIHRYAKILHQALRFFIIPAMLGVIGGLMASAVGMLIGQSLVLLWRSFYRRDTADFHAIDVMVLEDEKAPLMETDELPQYHDVVPQYKDVEAQVQTEKGS